MAKSHTIFMSWRPYSLLRQALPSSLLHLPKPHSVMLNKTRPNFLLSCANRTKLHFETHGFVKLGFGSVGNRRFSIEATRDVNDAGSIDSPLMQSMENKIKEELTAESVSVKDAYGDGRHVCIDVISEAFEGQSAVNRQRMVYKAIWEELQSTVHAVDQMTTRTPTEAAAQK
ncbi:PREDICTED: sufE-like protein, chloroplastic [Populus euphratica]|uniref:SufE-like protein, chloroplastic n=1 Tax=Populus euphratica TaxID=75702 RepID=A0AAJ6TDQ0_POPEU|nr:PREDICTED: sufE-like protein, chloroplastic [Populus euphratica]